MGIATAIAPAIASGDGRCHERGNGYLFSSLLFSSNQLQVRFKGSGRWSVETNAKGDQQ